MSLFGLCLFAICGASFLALLNLGLHAAGPRLREITEGLKAQERATALFALRFAPVVGALVFCLFFLLPAWALHEPADSGEVASSRLVLAAALAFVPVLAGLLRGALMFERTRHRLRSWRLAGSPSRRGDVRLVSVDSEDLALCVGGYFRPAIYASSDLLSKLDADERDAALAHEAAHARALDPLRVLLMAACPDWLGLFKLDAEWRQAFARACEFAADRDAAGGSPARALDLASALLKVARLGAPGASAAALKGAALASAYSSGAELRARVEALAMDAPPAARARAMRLPAISIPGFALTTLIAGFVLSGAVHEGVELIGRLLR